MPTGTGGAMLYAPTGRIHLLFIIASNGLNCKCFYSGLAHFLSGNPPHLDFLVLLGGSSNIFSAEIVSIC